MQFVSFFGKKKLFRGFAFVGVTFLILILSFFLFRNTLFDFFIHKFSERLQEKYGIRVTVGERYMIGLNECRLENVTLFSTQNVNRGSDTLASVNRITASFRFWPLLTGAIRTNQLLIDSCEIFADGFLKLKPKNKNAVSHEINIGQSWNTLTDAAFHTIPSDFEIHSMRVFSLDTLGNRELIGGMQLSKLDTKVDAKFYFQEHALIQTWILKGFLDSKNKSGHMLLCSADTHAVVLPFISERKNTRVVFDTLECDFAKQKEDFFRSHLTIRFNNLHIFHPRLSLREVVCKYLKISGNVQADTSQIFNDANIQINGMQSAFSLRYKPLAPKQLGFTFSLNEVPASVFFESLPEGMFNAVRSIRADGTLSFQTEFFIDTRLPDSLTFQAELKKKDFSIRNYGNSDLLKMNGPFEYTAFENDMPARKWIVGPESPMFTPISNISPYLKNAVLTSEDGSFFYHRGFNEDAFRQSIALNFNKGKFVRGGSTISMQLVKNVFLNRKKNLSRKLEEALLVWLIENNRLCSKERMFEIYLNIIEWGPGIYGVKEASAFYFKKRPSDLTLAESIFMASIIPRPKSFRYAFDAQGNLKAHLAGYYRLVSEILYKKELISQNDLENLRPSVELKGAASQWVLPSDSLLNDSLQIDDNKFME